MAGAVPDWVQGPLSAASYIPVLIGLLMYWLGYRRMLGGDLEDAPARWWTEPVVPVLIACVSPTLLLGTVTTTGGVRLVLAGALLVGIVFAFATLLSVPRFIILLDPIRRASRRPRWGDLVFCVGTVVMLAVLSSNWYASNAQTSPPVTAAQPTPTAPAVATQPIPLASTATPPAPTNVATATPVLGPKATTPTPTNAADNPAVDTPEQQSECCQTMYVANTDGIGVYVRSSPMMADKIRAYADGTEFEVIGSDVAGEGRSWKHVRAPDGVTGFVPSEYLI